MCLSRRVSRDASLDEFVGGGSESEVSEDVGSGVEAADVEDDDSGNSEAVSPASATYAWTPDGEACVRCGSSVDRLWRCEGELVCGDCKEW